MKNVKFKTERFLIGNVFCSFLAFCQKRDFQDLRIFMVVIFVSEYRTQSPSHHHQIKIIIDNQISVF